MTNYTSIFSQLASGLCGESFWLLNAHFFSSFVEKLWEKNDDQEVVSSNAGTRYSCVD